MGVTGTMPNAPYSGSSPAALKTAFDSVIGGVTSCNLTISVARSTRKKPRKARSRSTA